MTRVAINEVGTVGIIADRQAHELPLNAWSGGQNIRMRDQYVEKSLGYTVAFGTPTVAPYYLLAAANATTRFWTYAGLNKIYCWDGAAHTDISRTVGGNYSATALRNWTGSVLGGIPVLNNGVDVPQFWSPVNTVGNFENLTAWNAGWSCAAMRAYKRFLIAMDVTKAGTRYPQMIKWSHPADPGFVPGSWDETDPTKDAGEYEIKDTQGEVFDCCTLRDANILYKADAVHAMQFIGGVDIFRFQKLFDSFGVFTRRSSVEYTAGKHAVFAVGDLIMHDGQNWQSIASKRLRRWLFNQIDPTNYSTCFVVSNPARFEVWFCFPQTGNSFPNKAVVWNWQDNAMSVIDLPGVAHIAAGLVDTSGVTDTWDGAVGTWDSDSSTWGELGANPSSYRLLEAYPSAPLLLRGDDTEQNNGVSFTSYIERLSLPIPLTNGGPPDMESIKFVRDIWPRIEGTDGGVVRVYIGSQMAVDGAITYKGPYNYTIGMTQHIPVRVSGRLISIKFESIDATAWRLHGYELDVVRGGRF